MLEPRGRCSRSRRATRASPSASRRGFSRGDRSACHRAGTSGVRGERGIGGPVAARRPWSQSDARVVARRGRRRPCSSRRNCRGSGMRRWRSRYLHVGALGGSLGQRAAASRVRSRRRGHFLIRRCSREQHGRGIGTIRLACAGPGLLRLLARRLGAGLGGRRRLRLGRLRRAEDPHRQCPQDEAQGEKLDTGKSSHDVIALRPARMPALMIARSELIHATAPRQGRVGSGAWFPGSGKAMSHVTGCSGRGRRAASAAVVP